MKSLTWHLPTTVCHSLESLFQLTFSARSSPHLKVFALEANQITSKGFTIEVYGTLFLTNFLSSLQVPLAWTEVCIAWEEVTAPPDQNIASDWTWKLRRGIGSPTFILVKATL